MILRAGRLFWRASHRFLDHNGPDRAAAVAYYTLLSLLPLLIFLISVAVAFVGSFDAAYRGTFYFFRGLFEHLDERSQEALRAFVERSVRFQWAGVALLAWTSRRIFASLFSALEAVFEVKGRGFARGNLVALAMVLVTGGGVLATLALTTVLATAEGILRRYVPTGALLFQNFTSTLLAHVVPIVFTLSFFFIVYRLVPRRAVTTTEALTGAVLATVLWEGAKAGFAYYVRNLARYGGLYGALEAVIVLALWLELSVSIILFCGEVVALLAEARRPAASGA